MKITVTKLQKTELRALKLITPVVIGGAIIPAGNVVEVDEFSAIDLIGRNRAIAATAEEIAASPESVIAPLTQQNMKWVDVEEDA